MNDISVLSENRIETEILSSVSQIKKKNVSEGQIRYIAKGTVKLYMAGASEYFRFCSENNLPILDENLTAIRLYRDFLRGRYSASTANLRIVSVRRTLLQWAKNRLSNAQYEQILSYLKSVPGISRNKNFRIIGEDKIVSEEEIHLLINSLPNNRKVALMIEFLYKTGCRVFEMTNITLAKISEKNKENYQIEITGKGDKNRTVSVKKSLIERIQHVFNSSAYLFQTKNGGKYYEQYINREIRRASKRILGHSVHPHMLRHSFVTHMIQKSGKIKAVSEYVGHYSSAFTLDAYCHEHLTDTELDSVLR